MQELRKDELTAQKIDTGLIFQRMLGTDDARTYLSAENIPEQVIERVLSGAGTARCGAAPRPVSDAAVTPHAAPRANAAEAAPAVAGAAVSAVAAVDGAAAASGIVFNSFYSGSGRRRNVVAAAVVQAALAVRDEFGHQRAIRLLRREKLPDDVIARVLGNDDRARRAR